MTKSGQLWGGRFDEAPHEIFAEFNDSLHVDKRLFVADISASIAHANALAAAGVINGEERNEIIRGLTHILEAEAANEYYFDNSDAEDVHSFIEGKLIETIGEHGRRLHAGRSRNDQVATAFRLWVRFEIDSIRRHLRDLQTALVDLAERHATAIMPGYTHLQRAQPILFGHWCLAYFEMLGRDHERLVDARRRVNILPLGSGAIAGSGFAIDRAAVAQELGFDGITANSIDAVSDRDFAIEFVAACSLIMAHLSRLAEDLIIYCSAEFGFISIGDNVSSGSSLMPQKKNPDALELLRGKAGRVFGNNMALLTIIKGQPLAYNKDNQEDKEAVFDTSDTVNVSLRAAALVLRNSQLNEERALEAASSGYLNATELADHLVRTGMPFRNAHEAVGKTVLYGIQSGKELHDMSLDELRQFVPDVDDDVVNALSLRKAVETKSVVGGTSPDRVREALSAARLSLEN